MKSIVLLSQTLLAVCMIAGLSLKVSGQTSNDNYTGFWSDDTTWTSGTAPDSVLTNGVNIDIYGFVTQNGDITVTGNSTGGHLYIDDTLWVMGNLTVLQKGTVTVTATGVLVVSGNMYLTDKSQLQNNGRTVVKGDLTVTDKTSLSNPSDAFYVFGTVTDTSNKGIAPIQDETDLTAGPYQDDPLNIFINSYTPLPITLLSFQAQAAEGSVQLHWATAGENNLDYFTIERAGEDGNFEAIATIQGKSSSTEAAAYHFNDKNPVAGMNLYRLKTTDVDGTVQYYPVVSAWVEQSHPTKVVVYPNPLQGQQPLFIDTDSQVSQEVTIADFFGHVVVITRIGGGTHQIDLPENLRPGSYLVSVTQPDGTQQHIRLLKN